MESRIFGKAGMHLPVVGTGTWKTFDVRGAVAKRNARTVVDAAGEPPWFGPEERALVARLATRL